MAELKNRYALALFELSLESYMLLQNTGHAAKILDIFKENGLDEFLSHPHIPKAKKTELLQKLFGKGYSEEILGFLHLCIEKNRQSIIKDSLLEFIEMSDRHRGILKANIVSALPLDSNQIQKIKNLLEEKTKKTIIIENNVNKSLIGGFYIQIDGRLIDCTIKTRLIEIKESLKKGVPNDY